MYKVRQGNQVGEAEYQSRTKQGPSVSQACSMQTLAGPEDNGWLSRGSGKEQQEEWWL